MVGPNWDTLDLAGKSLGEAEPGRMLKDRKHLDYLRVFASRPAIVGRTLGELGLPGENAAVIAHVRRGDTDLLARSDLVLEFGDRVGLVANPSDFAEATLRVALADPAETNGQLLWSDDVLHPELGRRGWLR